MSRPTTDAAIVGRLETRGDDASGSSEHEKAAYLPPRGLAFPAVLVAGVVELGVPHRGRRRAEGRSVWRGEEERGEGKSRLRPPKITQRWFVFVASETNRGVTAGNGTAFRHTPRRTRGERRDGDEATPLTPPRPHRCGHEARCLSRRRKRCGTPRTSVMPVSLTARPGPRRLRIARRLKASPLRCGWSPLFHSRTTRAASG